MVLIVLMVKRAVGDTQGISSLYIWSGIYILGRIHAIFYTNHFYLMKYGLFQWNSSHLIQNIPK